MRHASIALLAATAFCACSGCICFDFDGDPNGTVDPPMPPSGSSSTGGIAGNSSTGGVPGSSSTGGTAGTGGACGCGQSAPDAGFQFAGVPVGSPCQSDSDCGPNGSCQPPLDLSNGASPTVWFGGYCTGVGCTSSAQCPSGAECFLYPGTQTGLCLADCGTAACQRQGYTCSAVGDPTYACLPECHQDVDCGPSLVCDNGACAPPCASASDCAAGEICSSGHCQAGPPQSCSASCGCPAGQSCQGGECVTPCAHDADCPIGERCSSTDVCE